jgi:predicted nucleotide-binding protein
VIVDAETSAAIDAIQQSLNQIDALSSESPYGAAHMRWILGTKFTLERLFGIGDEIVQNFVRLDYRIPGGTIIQGWDVEAAKQQASIVAYRRILDTARGLLQAAIDRLELVPLSEMRQTLGLTKSPDDKSIFLSHGGDPPMLAKIERIVRTLGFNPIIVSRGPSQGKAVDDLVPEEMKKCVCVIILATRDEENPDSRYPRPNVLHEIGLAQEILHDRIIYLKERGVDFPSNVAPKVWETFENENLEPVWDKIVRELKGFHLIQ